MPPGGGCPLSLVGFFWPGGWREASEWLWGTIEWSRSVGSERVRGEDKRPATLPPSLPRPRGPLGRLLRSVQRLLPRRPSLAARLRAGVPGAARLASLFPSQLRPPACLLLLAAAVARPASAGSRARNNSSRSAGRHTELFERFWRRSSAEPEPLARTAARRRRVLWDARRSQASE